MQFSALVSQAHDGKRHHVFQVLGDYLSLHRVLTWPSYSQMFAYMLCTENKKRAWKERGTSCVTAYVNVSKSELMHLLSGMSLNRLVSVRFTKNELESSQVQKNWASQDGGAAASSHKNSILQLGVWNQIRSVSVMRQKLKSNRLGSHRQSYYTRTPPYWWPRSSQRGDMAAL